MTDFDLPAGVPGGKVPIGLVRLQDAFRDPVQVLCVFGSELSLGYGPDFKRTKNFSFHCEGGRFEV